MQNYTETQAKKLAALKFQDKIIELHRSGKSVRQIADLLNKRYIPRSNYRGIALSKSTVHNIIKKVENAGHF